MAQALKLETAQSMSAEDFQALLDSRPEDERWQLVDGVPFMMTPATGRHQRIAANLEGILNRALVNSQPALAAIREIGLMVAAHPDFRAIADVAITPFVLDDRFYFTEFHLAAEVLSPSNAVEHIAAKRTRYADGPDCRYVLIVHQPEIGIEVWSRLHDWTGRIYRAADDRVELPEFGATFAVGELYLGTPLL